MARVNKLLSQEIVIKEFSDIFLSLHRFESAFKKAWSIYGTEDDEDPFIGISFFKGPALNQKKYITDWIDTPFRSIMNAENADSWFTDDQEEALNVDNNFIKLISNSGSKKICIDEIITKKKTSEENIPVVVLNIDAGVDPFPDDTFLPNNLAKPLVIVMNEKLLVNKKAMDFLFNGLKPLDREFKANRILENLNNQLHNILDKPCAGLKKKIMRVWNRRYQNEGDHISSIQLCFFDALLLDEQREYVDCWGERMLKPLKDRWFGKDNESPNNCIIRLISCSEGDKKISMETANVQNKYPEECITTIFSFDSKDKPLELPNDIKNPVVIVVNDALLEKEDFVDNLFQYFIKIKNQDGATECLSSLCKKCPKSTYIEQATTIIKAYEDEKEVKRQEAVADKIASQEGAKQSTKAEPTEPGETITTFSHPMLKNIAIITIVGSSVALLAWLVHYFKSSAKSLS